MLHSILIFLAVQLSVAFHCKGRKIINATQQKQTIVSADFDNGYSPLLDCTYIIKSVHNSRVVFNINNLIMEPKIFSKCADSLVIYDGENIDNSKIIASFCESTHHVEIYSRSSSAIIRYQTDETFQFSGANVDVNYYELGKCPVGWDYVRNNNCIKVFTDIKKNWIDAQKSCNMLQSNLFTFYENQTNVNEELFQNNDYDYWLGYHDAVIENVIEDISIETPYFPKNTSLLNFQENNDKNDCMMFEAKKSAFIMRDCSIKSSYICKMNIDGSTFPNPPPIRDILDGSYSGNTDYTILLLIFLIGLLLLIVLTFLSFMCWKQKTRSRIHSQQQSTVQHSNLVEAGNNPSVTNIISHEEKGHKNLYVKEFPQSPKPRAMPLPKEILKDNVGETAILQGPQYEENDSKTILGNSGLPPVLPARELTFQSVNTRDSSLVKTKKLKDCFGRPVINILDNVSAISLDEFWNNKSHA